MNSLSLQEVANSLWSRLYRGYFPSLIHSTLFNALFFGTFSFFWGINNRDFMHDLGLTHTIPHQRGSKAEDRQPIHYELIAKCLLVTTCAYTASQLICYPIGVYKNMK